MTNAPIRTVIVDDEHLARRRLRALLAPQPDFEVVAECEDGPEAVRVIREMTPDFVLLDIKMVELDGLDVARAITAARAPLIAFVSAYDEYALDAFGVSAVDYLLKPFDEQRFAATLDRVRDRMAKDRRDDSGAPRQVYRCGDLMMDIPAHTVRRGERLINLRPKEFDLLLALIKRPGIVITKRELLEEVWGYQGDVMSRTIDTHLAEVRRKLSGTSGEPECIETVARIGYRLVDLTRL